MPSAFLFFISCVLFTVHDSFEPLFCLMQTASADDFLRLLLFCHLLLLLFNHLFNHITADRTILF